MASLHSSEKKQFRVTPTSRDVLWWRQSKNGARDSEQQQEQPSEDGLYSGDGQCIGGQQGATQGCPQKRAQALATSHSSIRKGAEHTSTQAHKHSSTQAHNHTTTTRMFATASLRLFNARDMCGRALRKQKACKCGKLNIRGAAAQLLRGRTCAWCVCTCACEAHHSKHGSACSHALALRVPLLHRRAGGDVAVGAPHSCRAHTKKKQRGR
jgi:hypothetical protein